MNKEMDVSALVRENIRNLIPYRSARSEFDGKAKIFIDANENPFESGINRYPDPYQMELKFEIGKQKNVPINNIMLGNGSDEIIDILIRVFCNPGMDSIYTFAPSFGMFDVAAGINDVSINKHLLGKDFLFDPELFLAEIPEHCKIVFLCSPNNPTGNSVSLESVELIASSVNCIVVIDEAYIDFSDHDSMIGLLPKYENLVILQTFSKAIGGAGLRIGMAFSNSYIIDLLHKVKMPYNISKVNQQVALDRLLKKNEIELEIVLIKSERKRLEKELAKLSSIKKIFSSDANFLLVRVENAEMLYAELISAGIVVRNRSSLIGCNNCLRISIGTPEENDDLLRFLKNREASNIKL
jgi:histidinol-phosphate aminotransferase